MKVKLPSEIAKFEEEHSIVELSPHEKKEELVVKVAQLAMESLPAWKIRGLDATAAHYRRFSGRELHQELRDLQARQSR